MLGFLDWLEALVEHFGAPLGSTRAIALHFDDTTRKIVKIGATTPPPPSSSPSS